MGLVHNTIDNNAELHQSSDFGRLSFGYERRIQSTDQPLVDSEDIKRDFLP